MCCLCGTMSSVDKVVMLEALGWSRDGVKDKHLPDDIINIIRQFAFFDIRTDAYQDHLEKEDIKADLRYVLRQMVFQINDGLKRYETGKFGVEYNTINVGSNCCSMCGNFVALWDPIPENIRCCCKFISDDEIMDLEYQRYDNYFWEEDEEDEREYLRKKQNKEQDEELQKKNVIEDDLYSDEDSECSSYKSDYDCYDNSCFY